MITHDARRDVDQPDHTVHDGRRPRDPAGNDLRRRHAADDQPARSESGRHQPAISFGNATRSHCPIGAGPVPTEQIVLAGSGGWILNRESHRDLGRALVVRRSLERVESAVPRQERPCVPRRVHEHRPDRDLRGGRLGPTSAGQHRVRLAQRRHCVQPHVAPGFGPVAAATPTTAIIGGNGTLWRTTDGGASWSVVGKFGHPDADPESTSASRPPTQGFAVVQNGADAHDARRRRELASE